MEYILYHSAGNLYWKDKDLKYLGCNENFLRITQLQLQEEIIGKTDEEMFLEYLGAEGIKKLRDIDHQVIAENIEIVCEEIGINEKGEKSTFLTKKLPLKNQLGEIIGLIGTSIDITDQKRFELEKKFTEEELQKTKYQLNGAQLIGASIAHEIRTPLATEKASIGIVDRTIKKILKEIKSNNIVIPNIREKDIQLLNEHIDLINKKIDQCNKVINMLLEKLKGLEFSLHDPQIFSALDCISQSLIEISVPDDMKNKINFLKECDFKITGNFTIIMHIIMNLLKNAFFYIQKAKKGEILIWLEHKEHFNEIHFKDTAYGISKEVLPNIFKPFFTTETSTGTGIGLAFSKMVMESHRGKIECLTEEGNYTKFILSFPKFFDN